MRQQKARAKASVDVRLRSAWNFTGRAHNLSAHLLKVGVSGFQHRREAGGFHFAAFSGAGLFKAPMQTDLQQSLFAVQFLFETA